MFDELKHPVKLVSRPRIVSILQIVLEFQVDHACFLGEKRVQILAGKWNKKMKERLLVTTLCLHPHRRHNNCNYFTRHFIGMLRTPVQPIASCFRDVIPKMDHVLPTERLSSEKVGWP